MSDGLADQLTGHYRDWFRALAEEGSGPLDALLAEEWTYTNYDGLVRGKAEYLEWVVNLAESLTIVGPDDVQVRQYGDIVVVLGGYRVIHPPGALELRFTGVWVRRDDRWQCLIHHNSEVSG